MHVEEPVAVEVVNAPENCEAETDQNFCGKRHKKCGHACKGVNQERKCMPCLHRDCAQAAGHFEGVTEDELCTICYTQELGDEPCTKLSCGHVFHTNCLVQLLKHRWSTLRITFAFMSCPSCKQDIELKSISRPVAKELGPLLHLKKTVEFQALDSAQKQGLLTDERLTTPTDAYFGKPQEFAMHRCSFYQCFKCKKPYFGGLIDCEQDMANAERDMNTKPEDLLCQKCLLSEIGAGSTKCEKHGFAQIDWKCQYCCSIAVFCCFGTTYFCEPCHNAYNGDHINQRVHDCHGIDCPLGIPHPPPNGDFRKGGVFPLGCGICRSEKIELLRNAKVQQVVTDAEDQPKALIGQRNNNIYGNNRNEVAR